MRPSRHSRRRRRSDKHVEEREEALPWPIPQMPFKSGKHSSPGSHCHPYMPHNRSASFLDIYSRVPPIHAHTKLGPSRRSDISFSLSAGTGMSAPSNLFFNPLTVNSSNSSFFPDDRATLESVNQKLNQLLLEQKCSKELTTRFQTPNNTNPLFSLRPSFAPTTTISSEDVCTLFPPTPSASVQTGVPSTPIGVFWDIENCQVPSGKSALVAVQRIRDRFFKGYVEAEFVCVCDIRKEPPQVIQELNDAQVSVVHVSGNSKNAADDKLRQAMRRYADTYSACSASAGSKGATPCSPPAVLLISGDVNFATDLSDLRHRKRVYVVLLHNKHAPESLILCANEHYDFHAVLDNLPGRQTNPHKEFFEPNRSIPLKGGHSPMDVVVTDLPQTRNLAKLKNRLRKLSDNCGGKVVTIQGQFAVLRFPNKEAALRASKRMNGEDVFGSKIRVIYSSQMDFNVQGQMSGNGSHPQIPIQPLVSVAPMMVPGTTSDSGLNGSTSHQAQLPNQPLVSVAPMMLPGSTSGTSAWKPTWNRTHFPVASMDELSLGDKASEGHLMTQSGSSVVSQNEGGSSGSNSSSREHSPTSASACAPLQRSKVSAQQSTVQLWTWNGYDQSTLKREVAALLQDVPNHSLPLFKFREMFEKRYRRSVSSADLYKMRDVVSISESPGSNSSVLTPGGSTTFSSFGRTITLEADWTSKVEEGFGAHCTIHPPGQNGSGKARLGWAEREMGASMPNVVIDFRVLSHSVHALLESHGGGFPLLSFLDCYEASFEPIERAGEGTPSVHLEHLVASVQGVEIVYGENGMKRVQWCGRTDFEPTTNNQAAAVQLAQLSRELVDLLKTFPKCSLPFSKIIPAYHHHYGRQCRVADYGHTSLSSLLLTLPNTIQILGEGQARIVTLAHRAQMKRFTTDVLRVLKAQPGLKKQIHLEDFSSAFTQLFPNRVFIPEDYGLCFFSDLISELVENSSLVTLITDENGGTLLSIPKREQTPQEVHRTRVFATEVVELLGHAIRCEMPFAKFIPAYHHHFGRQCRVSDYGFSKLAELFEAIGETVVAVSPVSNPDCSPEDKIIRLAPREQVKVIGEQIWKLVDKRNKSGHSTRINDLEDLFISEHGFALRPELCGAADVHDLIEGHLSSYAQLEGDRIVLLGRPLSAQSEQSSALALLQPAPDSRGRYRSNSKRFSALNKGNRPNTPHQVPSSITPTTGYDMWMVDNNGISGSPPVSPPIVWTYHPICYSNPYSPGTPANVLMPSFPYNQWSPPPGQALSQVRLF